MKYTLAVLLLLFLAITTFLLWPASKRSEDVAFAEMLAERERESHKIVSHSDDPLIHALFAGDIQPGALIQAVTSKLPPLRTETFGSYSIDDFDEPGYSWRTLVTYDDRVVRATVGSCTWDWTFFDNLPSEALTTISRLRYLRKYLKNHPESEEMISRLIQEQLSKLD